MSEHILKKCKPNYRANEVEGCGVPHYNLTYGLCPSCLYDWTKTTERGGIWYEKRNLKKIQKEEKIQTDFETYKKERKQNEKLATLLKSVKTVCHKYIRLRDKGKPCISCQNPYKLNHQAGHFYKAELFSLVRFNEFNINGQCEQCNLRREGNESEYRINLPLRIGLENFEELNKLASFENKTIHKWDRQKLIEIRKYYNKKIKNYE